jgi:hypothetical protein
MAENFIVISKEDIENVENALKVNSDYKLKNTKFNTKTFEKGQDIVLIQYVANVENELVFQTKEENGKYYISETFDLFMDNIINGNVSRDVFQSVSSYFYDVIENEDNDFEDEKEELINFLLLTEEYHEEDLIVDLDPSKIRDDYKKDYNMIYSDESLNRVQKSLALKELVHMSICHVVNELDLFQLHCADNARIIHLPSTQQLICVEITSLVVSPPIIGAIFTISIAITIWTSIARYKRKDD